MCTDLDCECSSDSQSLDDALVQPVPTPSKSIITMEQSDPIAIISSTLYAVIVIGLLYWQRTLQMQQLDLEHVRWMEELRVRYG
ncbi:uncharacterized protein LTR77_009985 [Saxophila tyrrhenica]|uniref:Uncharacterized protein n=1 Tax=Saxophila tyrrhenica TaxID=1690608 RepID=A0AAV9NX52_9PEZI|nr:hypothetical protein LTR77_009985 [Saxophila tyrrhenica]